MKKIGKRSKPEQRKKYIPVMLLDLTVYIRNTMHHFLILLARNPENFYVVVLNQVRVFLFYCSRRENNNAQENLQKHKFTLPKVADKGVIICNIAKPQTQ